MTSAAPAPESLPAALPGERLSIAAPGGRIACYFDAPSSPTDDTPLLLVHSINAAASAFEVKPLFEHYRATRPVYAIDLPGYGASDRSARAYTPRLMTDAILALIEVMGARHPGRSIDAVAVSLSSEYLARAAVEHPPSFRTVCLVSATGLNRIKRFDGPPGSTRGKPWLLKLLGRAPWSETLFRLLTRRAVIRFFLEKTWGSKDIDLGLLEYDVLTTRVAGASNAPFHFLSAILFSADITRVYESIAAPVLLVHGTKGDFTDYRGAPRLRDDFGWKIHVMPTGAMPYFEDLPSFVAAFEELVDTARSQPAPTARSGS